MQAAYDQACERRQSCERINPQSCRWSGGWVARPGVRCAAQWLEFTCLGEQGTIISRFRKYPSASASRVHCRACLSSLGFFASSIFTEPAKQVAAACSVQMLMTRSLVLQPELLRLAPDLIDCSRPTEKPCGVLDCVAMAQGGYEVVNVHFSPGFTVVNVDLLGHRPDRVRALVPSWLASGVGQSTWHSQPVQPVQTPYFGHCSLPPRQWRCPSSLESTVGWETFRRA
jgi:hypothetical protein